MFWILFMLGRAQDSVGTLQINNTLTLNTNVTDQAPSIIVSFLLPDERTSTIGCFISKSSIPQIDVESLSHFSSQFAYDLHGIQSNSNIQLVGFEYYLTLYLSCQSDWSGSIDYQLTYKEDYFNSGCVNDCQGYNSSSSASTKQSYCFNDYCECQTNQLGNFCQLPVTFVLSSNTQTVKLKPRQWKFFYYLFTSTDIVLQSSGQNIMFSLTLQDTPQTEIPNKENAFALTNATIQYTEATILYIGLLNTGDSLQNFNFTLVSASSVDQATIERNRIIIISVGSAVGALLVLTFLTSIIRTRRMQAQMIEQVRTRKTREQGFSQDFVKSYFGELLYTDLVKTYPGLLQFEECVICLESIKNGKTKQLRHCSVTPCFHVFHQKCLSQWLGKQRNCPFCRSEYSKVQIQSQYPWVVLAKTNEKQQSSNYISNLKHNNTDPAPEQLNESQQELVGKMGGVQEA